MAADLAPFLKEYRIGRITTKPTKVYTNDDTQLQCHVRILKNFSKDVPNKLSYTAFSKKRK
uniref:Uncharacterized protein n=1 Tax=Cannabis sativa TaxID=3483 RepID=A0A803QXM4_CANSA